MDENLERDNEWADATDAEREALTQTQVILDEMSQKTVDLLVDKLMVVCDKLSGHPLYEHQQPFARRCFESLIIDDGATITALFSRQSGKTETVANVIATAMIMLPRLAKLYPNLLEKFREGVQVGAFAPTDLQAETIFGRIVARLTSDTATTILHDPEINDRIIRIKRGVALKHCRSFVVKNTAHPRAKIEGQTFHIILVDECFPAGTPVLTSEGWVPIEDIVGNPDKDWLVATAGMFGLEWAPVQAAYKTGRMNELVRVDHEYGTFYCTANHPVMVAGERVPAITLRPGASLSVVPGPAEPPGGTTQEVQEGERSSLQQLPSSQTTERDGQPSSTTAYGTVTEEDWTSPFSPWGERDWTYRTPEPFAERSRRTVAGRVCVPEWKREQGSGLPSALQAGPGPSSGQDGNRSRRELTLFPEGLRLQEDGLAYESRVVGVAVLEPGDPEFAQFSDDADYVYTLGVDSDSHTYVAAGVLVGNCQDADNQAIDKSVIPMGSHTNATFIYTGTPTYVKNIFYRDIQTNKREALKRGARQNHFEVPWDVAARAMEKAGHPQYRKSVLKAMLKMGEGSDEFRLSFKLEWLIDKGMFMPPGKIVSLGDTKMRYVVHDWYKTPVVVGIDCGRIKDRTIVTVVFVDWNNPDPAGYYHHRVLKWLDLEGVDWENQYFRIQEFLNHYNIYKVGIDHGGIGDVVQQRLEILMPHLEFVPMLDDTQSQSVRWKYLKQLIDRDQITWPAGGPVQQLRTWRRFTQEMSDLQLEYKGPNMMCFAPNETNAHDDYPDSLAMACILSQDTQDTQNGGETYDNPFYGPR